MSTPRVKPGMKVTLIDNYDSFTWNLYHDLGKLGASIAVIRNDETTADAIIANNPDAIVLSPGPCTPKEAGICLDLIAKAGATIPLFGVCLGLQSMGQAYGGDVVRAPLPMHGKVSMVHHKSETVFRGINGPFKATRYHSLIVARETCPAVFNVTAETEDGLVMALSHREHPVHGVQFHPESIRSEQGLTIFGNFLALADEWNRQKRV